MAWFNPHEKFRRRLSAYIDGELGAREDAEVAGHVETCADCSRELTELRAALAALRALPEAEPPRSFAITPEMLARGQEPAPPAPLPKLQTGMRLASAALALALVAVFVTDNGLGGFNEGTREDAGYTSQGAASQEDQPLELGASGAAPPESSEDGDAPVFSSEPAPLTDVGERAGEPGETAAPISGEGAGAAGGDSASSLASASGGDGIDAVLLAEVLLLAALALTLSASIYLAIRDRRA